MKNDNQDEVCEFVREIISARTREPIALTERPDRERRDIKAVEELWESSSHRYAVEHTLIESFEGQLANLARIERLLVPVKDMLAGRLPGRFALAVRETDTSAARVNFAVAHQEVARLVLEAVDGMKVGETVTLGSKALPFELRLHLRFKEDSRLILYTDIEGDPEELRLERVRRALDAKCPKLATWARDGRTSILIFEADDIQHSNSSVVYSAVAPALAERNDQPDIVVLVETDGSPWSGWILKEGDRLGDDVPRNRDGGYLYERGRVRRSSDQPAYRDQAVARGSRGQREPSRSFSFAFLTPSFGLVEAPSSQRSTCIIVIACFAAGSRTSMSSTVAGPTCSIHGSPLNVRTPRIAASKSDSACTSTVCRMPRTSANETAQIRIGTA